MIATKKIKVWGHGFCETMEVHKDRVITSSRMLAFMRGMHIAHVRNLCKMKYWGLEEYDKHGRIIQNPSTQEAGK